MSSVDSHGALLKTSLLLTLTLHLVIPASCIVRPPPASHAQGLVVEDKVRLGSMPPSCHNRCSECRPCSAVQAPSLPASQLGDDPVRRPSRREGVGASPDDSPNSKQFANYKPLGWKCRCGDQLYNP